MRVWLAILAGTYASGIGAAQGVEQAVDINRDGGAEFFVILVTADGTDGGLRWGREDWTLRAATNTVFSTIAVLAYPPPATPAQPEAPPLQPHDSIPQDDAPPARWQARDLSLYVWGYVGDSPLSEFTPQYYGGMVVGQRTAYIAARLEGPDGVHLGWLKVERTDLPDRIHPCRIEVTDFGWQLAPGAPIRVGEKLARLGSGRFTASVVAGATESEFTDGPPAVARFGCIVALDGDDRGNLYVADAGNHRVRRVDRRGEVTTVAGTGEAVERDGPASGAAFRDLRDVGVDAKGNCYVLDGRNLRRVSAGGIVSTLGPIQVPTGEQSYTNYVGWGPDTTLVECTADEFYQVQDLTVSPAGVVRALGTATKSVRSVLLRFGTTTHTSTTNSALLHQAGGEWTTDIRSERSLWTCGGCTPPGGGEPPPISVNGTLIAAVSRGTAEEVLWYGEECRGTAERFGRISVLDAGSERAFATNLVGLPRIIDLANDGPDTVWLLGHSDSANGFFVVGRAGLTLDMPSDRVPDIGVVVDRFGIVYSATPTQVLRFVPTGIVILDLAHPTSGAPAWSLAAIAPVGSAIRLEQSTDLECWKEWTTFTSTGRDEWELPAEGLRGFFRAVPGIFRGSSTTPAPVSSIASSARRSADRSEDHAERGPGF